MTRRVLALPSLLLAAGCASQSFIDDVAFLKSHTEVVVLQDRDSDARVAVCPALQGRVMTSTATGAGGWSYGWIDRASLFHGGEDCFRMRPGGGPFDVAMKRPDSLLLRKKISLANASDLDVQREIHMLDKNEIACHLAILPGPEVRSVAYESRNKVTYTGNTAETGPFSIRILGMFNSSPATTVVIPYREGPADKLGPVAGERVPPDRLRVEKGALFFKGNGKIAVSPQRSLGILGSYDSDRGALTIIQFKPPKGPFDSAHGRPLDGAHSADDFPASSDAKACELESFSPTLTLRPGQSHLHIHRTFHFQGPHADLDAIAKRVLGMDLEQIAR
jgi:hypothetical protein